MRTVVSGAGRDPLLLLVCFCFLLSAGCAPPPAPPPESRPPLKVGMVTDVAGLGDLGFNDAAQRGLVKARDLGLDTEIIQPKKEADYEESLDRLAASGKDLVVAVGTKLSEAVDRAARAHPRTLFVVIDGTGSDQPNVLSVTFREEEGSYLAGALAGLTTRTKRVGFVGGERIPLIEKFEAGFKAGVKTTAPDCQVVSSYVGSFDNIPVGKSKALGMYNDGVDIVFQAAGTSGLGVISACQDKGPPFYVIGVDSNQDGIAPGRVLTSMIKGVDTAVVEALKAAREGTFKAGNKVLGLAERGIELSPMQYTDYYVPTVTMDRIRTLQAAIAGGRIKVPTTLADAEQFQPPTAEMIAAPVTAARQAAPVGIAQRLQALLGIALILALAFALSSDRKSIDRRTLAWGLGLQVVLAVAVLRGGDISRFLAGVLPVPDVVLGVLFVVALAGTLATRKAPKNRKATATGPSRMLGIAAWLIAVLAVLKLDVLEQCFDQSRVIVSRIIAYAGQGAQFVFGTLAGDSKPVGLVFAFAVLPTIIFVSSLFAILYYFGIMQKVVGFLARVMARCMGASGAESTSVAASIFMGQTEAPLTIRPYLPDLTPAELMTIMVSGMAHVSAGIMPAYVLMGGVDIKHLLLAVIMTAPGAILMARIFVPETAKPRTRADVKVDVPITDVNVVDAAARGAAEGGTLALNVAYMLIAFIAMVALVNGGIGYLHDTLHQWAIAPQAPAWLRGADAVFPARLEDLLGLVFAPLAWCLGVASQDASAVGSLLGTRMVLNEVVAYVQLGTLKSTLDPRSFVIATYALCGFANLASVAIQVGGIGALATTRRHDLARLGVRAMIAGTLANFLAAAIAALVI